MVKFELNQKKGNLKLDNSLNKISKIISKDFNSNGIISLVVLDDKEIKKINKQYRKKNKGTDILTFEINEKGELGEIILGYEKVKERSKKMKTSLIVTYIYLIIHGVCHIQNYTHNTYNETKKMEEKEDIYLKKMGYIINRDKGTLKKII